MNILAHIYLSGSSELVLTGNFIGDAVKGKKFDVYPEMVQFGIRLHRFIDSYTDTHPLVHKSKFLLNSGYGKYSGIVTDIFYDFFLSENWVHFSNIPLKEFIYTSYEILLRNSKYFPAEVQRYFPFFIMKNWLERYGSVEGMQDVLTKMSLRTSLPDKADFGISTLQKHYTEFEDHFMEFFPELINAIRQNFRIFFPEIKYKERFLPSA